VSDSIPMNCLISRDKNSIIPRKSSLLTIS
jgi:hypothetical protein